MGGLHPSKYYPGPSVYAMTVNVCFSSVLPVLCRPYYYRVFLAILFIGRTKVDCQVFVLKLNGNSVSFILSTHLKHSTHIR